VASGSALAEASPNLFAPISGLGGVSQGAALSTGEKKLNNLVSELFQTSSIRKSGGSFKFARHADGWIFISASHRGTGTLTLLIDDEPLENTVVAHGDQNAGVAEGIRFVARGAHQIGVKCERGMRVDRLVVRAIPELIDCGLFDPAIKAYGHYDMEFLKKDVLPNITTLEVPGNIKLPQAVIDNWHRQGKRFIIHTGINHEAQTPGDHIKHWTQILDRNPFADGIIIDEFIVNAPLTEWNVAITPELLKRIDQERQRNRACEQAFKQMRLDPRYKDKVYAYVGGSGKKLNEEVIGPTFVRTLIDCRYPIALERYLFERSSEQKSANALREFVDGIADWEAKRPGAKQNMIIAFGLFSMPPGGINKLPNVDFHVWMDQQMNTVANHPAMTGIGGLDWWTSSQADEETVRFVGKLYRHYGIEGRTDLLTKDPLFLTHIQNADFERGTESWTLHPAEEGSIRPGSFPRYGRIEGRYMGLGRPADPEHIGDTFLVMKRSEKGANTFSQTIRNLEPGRLYSMKMFSCDYNDLVNPRKKSREEAANFVGRVILDGVDVDPAKSFMEMYSSNPEPPVPVWITYHWKVFRAKRTTAKLTVSDWKDEKGTAGVFGLEQTFNFLEIQPYHE
jgi:hypothetical protein